MLDTVSGELDLASIQYAGDASWSPDAQLLTWDIGDIEPGAGGEVEFKVNVPQDADVGTTLFNIAEMHFPSTGEVTPTNPMYNVVSNVAANPEELEVVSGESKDIELSGSAVGSGDLTYAVTRQPLHGTLSGDAPELEYASEAGFVGKDDFEFVARQGTQQSAPARVVLTVQPSTSEVTDPIVPAIWPDGEEVRTYDEPVSVGVYLPVITATLSESIDPDTVDAQAMADQGQVAWDAPTRTLSFTPSEALSPGETYQVELGGRLADYAGNALDTFNFEFATAPARALRIALEPSVDSVMLGSNVGEKSKPATVAAESYGTQAVSIASVTITGKDASVFSIDEQTRNGAELDLGESCFVTIAGQSAQAGSFDASLVIDSDAGGESLDVPLALVAVGSNDGSAGTGAGIPDEGGSVGDEDDVSGSKTTTTACGCRAAGAGPDSIPWSMLAGPAWLCVVVRRQRPRQ